MIIDIYDEDNDEQFELSEDVRHGIDGFRLIRRVYEGETIEDVEVNTWDEKVYMWDESYQFYTSLDDAYKAIKTRDWEIGRAAF